LIPRLQIERVTKTYSNGGQQLTALDGVSLAVPAGTVTALLGRSGCGKSTLLNLAGAMDFPT
jgi:putative ABC transport system ATP-binding protein